jgi:hypothetical protein
MRRLTGVFQRRIEGLPVAPEEVESLENFILELATTHFESELRRERTAMNPDKE